MRQMQVHRKCCIKYLWTNNLTQQVIQHNSNNQSRNKSEMEITIKQLAICYVSSYFVRRKNYINLEFY